MPAHCGLRIKALPACPLATPPHAGGRVHTSAASVAVLPQAEEAELSIRDEDIRIDVYRWEDAARPAAPCLVLCRSAPEVPTASL